MRILLAFFATAVMLPAAGLQDMDWMTGGTWKAQAKSPDGKVTEVANNIRWSANKMAIVFSASFNGAAHYDGMYAWDPARNVIRFFYTSSDGELTTGTARMQGDTLEQEFEIVHTDGKAVTLRSTIVRRGPDAYHWNVQSNKDGKWTEMFGLDYVRTK